MNRPLRVHHRRMFAALVVLVPIGLATALTVRGSVPTVDRIPHAGPASIDWPEGQEHALDSGEWSAHFEARIAAGAGMGAVLELRPLEDWKRPDLLVYWSETEAEAPGPASTLIGKLAGTQRRRFALPLAASIAPGWITVFSLGHQETVFHAALAPPELQPWWASIGYDLSPDTDR